MYIVITSQGRRFETAAEESLLSAALRQNIVLDYSCRIGRCSSCKGRVRSGETAAVSEELGLSSEELAQGWILTCVRQARSDLELDIDDLGGVELPPPKTLPCRIRELERISADVIRVVLRLPPTNTFKFLPGQYIEVIGENGTRRSYSIANAPRGDGQIELHIREVPEGVMSGYWFQRAKPNDLLRIHGPLGTSFLRDQNGKDLILLATGTGIAPVKAILEGMASLPANQQAKSVSVYWGGRHAEDLYWAPPGNEIARFVPVLSRSGPDWAGARGYVQDVLLSDRPNLSNALLYACGSDTMIRAARASLVAAGLPEKAFRSDAFVCSSTH
jgi:CDP-4-dehydro-6-deoxyglucose reductase